MYLTSTTVWNNTTPTSTVFSIGNGTTSNKMGNLCNVCFAPKTGYSKFGKYTSNGRMMVYLFIQDLNHNCYFKRVVTDAGQ